MTSHDSFPAFFMYIISEAVNAGLLTLSFCTLEGLCHTSEELSSRYGKVDVIIGDVSSGAIKGMSALVRLLKVRSDQTPLIVIGSNGSIVSSKKLSIFSFNGGSPFHSQYIIEDLLVRAANHSTERRIQFLRDQTFIEANWFNTYITKEN